LNINNKKAKKLNQILDGILLGDASLGTTHKNYRLSMAQRELNNDLVDSIKQYFIENKIRTITYYSEQICYIKSKDRQWKSKLYTLLTESNEFFTKLRIRWYPEGKKIVQKDIELTPIVIGYWFMCDGSTTWMPQNDSKVALSLSTDGFTLDDTKFLQKELLKFNFNFWIQKHDKSFRLVLTRSHDVFKFLKLIERYMTNSFKYKIKYPLARTNSEAQKIVILQRQRDKKGRLI